MVKYALACKTCQSPFEAWFSNSDAFDEQNDRGLITCPECGGSDIQKQIMAPAAVISVKLNPVQKPPVRPCALAICQMPVKPSGTD